MVADVERTWPIVTVRDADEFRSRPLATIGNALEGGAGIMAQQSTYGQVSPFLRGLTGYHVLNLIDGVRFNNSTFRSGPNQYLAFVDPEPGAANRSDARARELSVRQRRARRSDSAADARRPGWPAARRARVKGSANLFAASADGSAGADASVVRSRARALTSMVGGSARTRRPPRRAGPRFPSRASTAVRALGRSDSGGHGRPPERTPDSRNPASTRSSTARLRTSAEPYGLVPAQRDGRRARLQGPVGRPRTSALGLRATAPALLLHPLRKARRREARLAERDLLDQFADAMARSVRACSRPTPSSRTTWASTRLATPCRPALTSTSRQALVFGGEIYDERIDARAGRDRSRRPAPSIRSGRCIPMDRRIEPRGLFVQDVVDLVRGSDRSALKLNVGGRFTRVDVETFADQQPQRRPARALASSIRRRATRIGPTTPG